jgi:hypothetical protein
VSVRWRKFSVSISRLFKLKLTGRDIVLRDLKFIGAEEGVNVDELMNL